eukprot:1103346-Alexandrium_andersonii.AAC.1
MTEIDAKWLAPPSWNPAGTAKLRQYLWLLQGWRQLTGIPQDQTGPRSRDVHDRQGAGVLHEGPHAHALGQPRLGERGLLAGAAVRRRGSGHDA